MSRAKRVPTKHHPTPEERDERVCVPIKADEFVEGVLAAGPHPEEDDEEAES